MTDYALDIEVYMDILYVGLKELGGSGRRVGFELSTRKPEGFDRAWMRRFLRSPKHRFITFNGMSYDMPVLWYAINPISEEITEDGEIIETYPTTEQIKAVSDRIITGNVRYWDADKVTGRQIPYDITHIDLIEPQPNAMASLKILGGRMHCEMMQDLPYPPDAHLNSDEMDKLCHYCLYYDLDKTELLWNTLKEPMDLRAALSTRYKRDFMSKSDSQIGEAIVKTRVEEITKKKVYRNPTKPGTTFRYPIPTWVKFETPQLQDLLERVRTTDFVVNKDGKTDSPKWMSGDLAMLKLGSEVYQFGIGGIHSTEANRATRSDDTHVLIDADVASQYPAAILMLGLYPPALGPAFLTAYGEVRMDRLAAKKRAKAIKGEMAAVTDTKVKAALAHELDECVVRDKGGKIQLNGVYGKLGSAYSILYAPHLLLSVTLTCQLAILMLVERAIAAGFDVVSGNTDGVLFRCPRENYAGLDGDRLRPSKLAELCSQWERDTGFDLEFGEYLAIFNRSVNDYYALKVDGGHKRKGVFGNPWSLDKSDYDPIRAQLMKNPTMSIVSDAALARIKHGTPLSETIRNCTDVRQFLTVIKVTKGATWRGNYLGKTIRYYWAKGGEEILEASPNPATGNYKKVPNTDGARELMRLPAELPDDIDYAKYIAEAEQVLKDVGFYGAPEPKTKRIRLTKANKIGVLKAWMTAP